MDHGVKENTERPDVSEEALVTRIYDDFWGQISWSSTLFMDDLAFFD